MTKDKEPLEEEKNQNSEESELNTLSYEEVLSQLEAAKEDSLRARAELENFKKRTSSELSNALKFANSELLSSLIPVLTSLEKATENLDDEKVENDNQEDLIEEATFIEFSDEEQESIFEIEDDKATFTSDNENKIKLIVPSISDVSLKYDNKGTITEGVLNAGGSVSINIIQQ